MAILLDTHAFVWWSLDDDKLSRQAFSAIQSETEVHVSAVIAWEIAGKVRTGKWPEATLLSKRFFATVAHYNMRHLPITLEHAHAAGSFSAAHRDPFDRMLAAQATLHQLPLVTRDPQFAAVAGLGVLW